jgi:hypothetical protein
VPRASQPSSPSPDEALTVPLVARAPAQTHTGLTSSADVREAVRPNRKRALLVAAILAAFGVIAAALVFGARGSAPEDATTAAVGETAPKPPAPAPAPAPTPPNPSVAPVSTSSAAAQGATPPSESSSRKTTKTAPPPTGGTKSTRDPKKVFGASHR